MRKKAWTSWGHLDANPKSTSCSQATRARPRSSPPPKKQAKATGMPPQSRKTMAAAHGHPSTPALTCNVALAGAGGEGGGGGRGGRVHGAAAAEQTTGGHGGTGRQGAGRVQAVGQPAHAQFVVGGDIQHDCTGKGGREVEQEVRRDSGGCPLGSMARTGAPPRRAANRSAASPPPISPHRPSIPEQANPRAPSKTSAPVASCWLTVPAA